MPVLARSLQTASVPSKRNLIVPSFPAMPSELKNSGASGKRSHMYRSRVQFCAAEKRLVSLSPEPLRIT